MPQAQKNFVIAVDIFPNFANKDNIELGYLNNLSHFFYKFLGYFLSRLIKYFGLHKRH